MEMSLTAAPASDEVSNEISLSSPCLVVVDIGSKKLQAIDVTTHRLSLSMDLGPGTWYGVCFHRPSPKDIYLAISECGSHTVNIFDIRSKTLIRSIGQGKGSAPGQLNNPCFLCTYSPADAGAALLVSNEGSSRIDMFDWDSGTYVRSIRGGEGSGPGQLQYPAAIAVWTPQDDPTNAQLVVADQGNHRLTFFRLSDGMYVRSVGEAGRRSALHKPMSLAIHLPEGGRDEDALLVTIGADDARIHVYSLARGEYLRCLGGGRGVGVDQLSIDVCGIVFHKPVDQPEADTQLIVSDRVNRRLQVYNLYTGAHMGCIGGRGSELFCSPMGMSLIEGDSGWDYVLK